MLGDYVTLEAGTGVVHTAPGHGADDFNTGQKYGLEILRADRPRRTFPRHRRAVRRAARVRRERERRAGAEEARAACWHRSDFSHQYPHCWRCHNPVIFLATSQWFIRMDGDPAIAVRWRQPHTLREAALHAIDHDVKWIPSWGHDRIYNMVVEPPRLVHLAPARWGVPIPAVDCTTCGEAITTPALVEKAAAVFEQHGADAWYERPVEEFLPPG